MFTFSLFKCDRWYTENHNKILCYALPKLYLKQGRYAMFIFLKNRLSSKDTSIMNYTKNAWNDECHFLLLRKTLSTQRTILRFYATACLNFTPNMWLKIAKTVKTYSVNIFLKQPVFYFIAEDSSRRITSRFCVTAYWIFTYYM